MQGLTKFALTLLALCASNVLAYPVTGQSNILARQQNDQSLEEMKAQYAEECEGKMFAMVYPPTPEQQKCDQLAADIKEKEGQSDDGQASTDGEQWSEQPVEEEDDPAN